MVKLRKRVWLIEARVSKVIFQLQTPHKQAHRWNGCTDSITLSRRFQAKEAYNSILSNIAMQPLLS